MKTKNVNDLSVGDKLKCKKDNSIYEIKCIHKMDEKDEDFLGVFYYFKYIGNIRKNLIKHFFEIDNGTVEVYND